MKHGKIGALLLALVLAVLAAGCGGKKVEADAAALADELKSSLTFQDEMTAAEDTVRDTLYTIDAADVKAGKLYISSGAHGGGDRRFRGRGPRPQRTRLYKAAQEPGGKSKNRL